MCQEKGYAVPNRAAPPIDAKGAIMATRRTRSDGDLHAIRADLDQLRKDIASLAKGIGGRGKDGAEHVGEQIRDHLQQGYAYFDHGADRVRDCVKDRPMVAVLAAMGAGMLIDRILKYRD